jgi:hypothetical protein
MKRSIKLAMTGELFLEREISFKCICGDLSAGELNMVGNMLIEHKSNIDKFILIIHELKIIENEKRKN